MRRRYRGVREDLGDLVTRRAHHSIEELDPFLFINHHGPQVYPRNNRGLPFGPHPHRGFETVTFIVEGVLTHRDTAGYESTIHRGGVQWMTAGSGVEHSETSPVEFLEAGGPLEILQLWVNLPSRLKMSPPRYQAFEKEQIPAINTADGDVTVRLVSGRWNGATGPVESLTATHMSVIDMRPASSLMLDAPPGRTVFLYIVRGELRVAGKAVSEFDVVAVNDDGDVLQVEARRESMIIFGHGEPLREPVAAYGPFVMNTHDEIRQAITDYQEGKFATKVRI